MVGIWFIDFRNIFGQTVSGKLFLFSLHIMKLMVLNLMCTTQRRSSHLQKHLMPRLNEHAEHDATDASDTENLAHTSSWSFQQNPLLEFTLTWLLHSEYWILNNEARLSNCCISLSEYWICFWKWIFGQFSWFSTDESQWCKVAKCLTLAQKVGAALS